MSGDLILPNGNGGLVGANGQPVNGSKPDARSDAQKDADANALFPMAETLVLIDGMAVMPRFLHGDQRACLMITIQGPDAKEADEGRQLRRAITGIMRYEAAMELSVLLKKQANLIPLKFR